MPDPDVTIVIRSKNEAKLLARCLDMLERQRTAYSFDVLLIDSGSTDRTVAIARTYPRVTVREIPAEAFHYAAVLNEGVRLARGRYVVALSAHCVPLDEEWLHRLVEPLECDPAVAASFGRQVPWPECELVEKSFLEREFAEKDYTLAGPPPGDDPLGLLFSNANSCLRRETVLARPFPRVDWAEDRAWAAALLAAGHCIAYAGRAAVFHSHGRTVRGYYRLGFVAGRALRQLGARPRTLSASSWFGVRRLWWAFDFWRAECRRQGVRPSGVLLEAARSLCRVIAKDLGVWAGQRAAPGGGPLNSDFGRGAGFQPVHIRTG